MDGPKQLFAPFFDQLLIGFLNLFWSGLDFGLAAIAYVLDQVAPGLNDEPKVFEVLAGNCQTHNSGEVGFQLEEVRQHQNMPDKGIKKSVTMLRSLCRGQIAFISLEVAQLDRKTGTAHCQAVGFTQIIHKLTILLRGSDQICTDLVG